MSPTLERCLQCGMVHSYFCETSTLELVNGLPTLHCALTGELSLLELLTKLAFQQEGALEFLDDCIIKPKKRKVRRGWSAPHRRNHRNTLVKRTFVGQLLQARHVLANQRDIDSRVQFRVRSNSLGIAHAQHFRSGLRHAEGNSQSAPP